MLSFIHLFTHSIGFCALELAVGGPRFMYLPFICYTYYIKMPHYNQMHTWSIISGVFSVGQNKCTYSIYIGMIIWDLSFRKHITHLDNNAIVIASEWRRAIHKYIYIDLCIHRKCSINFRLKLPTRAYLVLHFSFGKCQTFGPNIIIDHILLQLYGTMIYVRQ